jgi:hypothetical protein
MELDLETALTDHLRLLTPEALGWGWKEPRSSFLLPFIHSCFRNLRFLHVVRDGRDMAYSSNQNQLSKHGRTLLRNEETEWPRPLQSMAVWSRHNLRVAEYAEEHLRERYLRIRFEDLCASPVVVIRRVLEFFSLKGDPQELASGEVFPPSSLGRWRDKDRTIQVAFQTVGGSALRRFGYSES